MSLNIFCINAVRKETRISHFWAATKENNDISTKTTNTQLSIMMLCTIMDFYLILVIINAISLVINVVCHMTCTVDEVHFDVRIVKIIYTPAISELLLIFEVPYYCRHCRNLYKCMCYRSNQICVRHRVPPRDYVGGINCCIH